MTSTQGETNFFGALNEDTSTNLTEATIQKLLKNPRQRAILNYLHTHDGPAKVEAMIGHLILQESDSYPSDITAELSDQVVTAVWTVHLPTLAAHDIVRYDRQSGMVRWWRNAGRLTHYLRDPQISYPRGKKVPSMGVQPESVIRSQLSIKRRTRMESNHQGYYEGAAIDTIRPDAYREYSYL